MIETKQSKATQSIKTKQSSNQEQYDYSNQNNKKIERKHSWSVPKKDQSEDKQSNWTQLINIRQLN